MRSPVPTIRITRIIPLLMAAFSHSTPDAGSGQVVRSKLGCKHELPVQPDCHAFRATDLLNPIPEDTMNRHWRQPLVTDSRSEVVKLS